MEQTLAQYKIFYTVATSGNISHAAEELYISQPAISKSIRKLEEALDTTLFLRSSRGVTLTEEGELLYRHVKTAFESITFGEERIKKYHELGMGHLKIGTSSTLCKYKLIPCLTRFVSDYPHIRISIECQSSSYTQQLLEKGKIDIGLIGRPISEENLTFHSLGNIHDIFVTNPSYLENLKLRTDYEDAHPLSSATFMMLDQDNLSRQYIDTHLNQADIQINNLLEITSMDLLIDFAKIGLGIACVIREFIQTELDKGLLVEVPLSSPIPQREIGLSYNPSHFSSPLLKNFISYFPL